MNGSPRKAILRDLVGHQSSTPPASFSSSMARVCVSLLITEVPDQNSSIDGRGYLDAAKKRALSRAIVKEITDANMIETSTNDMVVVFLTSF